MHTRHVHLDLVDYLENNVDEAAQYRISEHLRKCERCREDMETIASALSGLKSVSAESLPQAYFTGFLSRVRESLEKKSEKNIRWNPRIVYVTAPVLSIMVFIFLLLKAPLPDQPQILKESIMSIIVNLSPDDIAEVMGSQLHGEVMLEAENPQAYNLLLKKQFNASKVVKDALDDKSVSPSLNENDYQVVIESMNDEQVDHILVRLKERSLL